MVSAEKEREQPLSIENRSSIEQFHTSSIAAITADKPTGFIFRFEYLIELSGAKITYNHKAYHPTDMYYKTERRKKKYSLESVYNCSMNIPKSVTLRFVSDRSAS